MESLQILLYLLALVSSCLTFTLKNTSKADDVDYRLPDLVIPSHYAIDLILETDAFEKNFFSGVVAITLEIKEGSKTKDIVLHTKNLLIPASAISLVKKSREVDQKDQIIPILPPDDTGKGYVSDLVTDKLTLSTKGIDLEGDSYLLTIQYTGVIDDTSLYGFYKSSYMEEEVQKFLAVTQFAEGYARRAFPCFDEPALKAIFQVSITKPRALKAYSNTQYTSLFSVSDDLDKIQFKSTPKMSTYLVAFLVADFTCTSGDTTDEGVLTEVCSRPFLMDTKQRELAKSVAPLALNLLKTYTGVGYKSSDIGKMSLVALPDFALGAMENWGLTTFRERDLLWDHLESSNRHKQSVVSAITHEFSHQWFGDLVTFDWWSDVFINEGFATYFEYYGTDKMDAYTSWEMPQQFAIEKLQTAFLSDSSLDSKALSSPVGSLEEAASKFNDIAYNKGGSIFHMVHHFLTEDVFIKGLAQYIADNPYKNTVPEDIWNAMPAFVDELPLQEVMKNWIYEAGYPLLKVTRDGNDLKISQERFLDSRESPTKWYVPISYLLSTDDESKATETTPRTWLTPSADLSVVGELEGVDWIVLNNMQTGYYRVDYSDDLWDSITTTLKTMVIGSPFKIHVAQRAQIVDDLFALANANKKSYDEVLNRLSFLENEVEYYPWYSAVRWFDLLLQRVTNSKLRTSLINYITLLSSKYYKTIGDDILDPDQQISAMNQVQATMLACRLGVKDCILWAREQFNNYRDVPVTMRPLAETRPIIYCHGLLNSDDIFGDWDFLYNKLLEEDLSSEQVTIISALGCTTEVTVLNGYLSEVISNHGNIRKQDAASAFSSVYSNTQEGVDATLDFIIAKHQAISDYFHTTSNLVSLISNVANRFTKQTQIDKLNNFITNNGGLDEKVKIAGQNAVKTATDNLAWIKRFEGQIAAFFDDEGGGGSTIQLNIAVLCVTLTLVLARFITS